MVARGCTWLHVVARGCTWLHMVARGCTASNSIASVFDHHPYHPPPTTQLKELERIGRLTTSKRFGRGPRFYVVTDSAPANYYIVPLLKEKPSPYDFNLELKVS